jgi:hypothetical protein
MTDQLLPEFISLLTADLELEAPMRTAAAMLSRCPSCDFASTIVEGPMDSHNIDNLELLVARIAAEFGLEGSVHLHARSYSVRFSHPRAVSVV